MIFIVGLNRASIICMKWRINTSLQVESILLLLKFILEDVFHLCLKVPTTEPIRVETKDMLKQWHIYIFRYQSFTEIRHVRTSVLDIPLVNDNTISQSRHKPLTPPHVTHICTNDMYIIHVCFILNEASFSWMIFCKQNRPRDINFN